jgi:predicted DNA binding protein
MTGDVERPPSGAVTGEPDVERRVQSINALTRQVGPILDEAGSRADLEAAVCSLVGSLDTYPWVWVGRSTATSDRMTIQATAGFDLAGTSPVDGLPSPVETTIVDNAVNTGLYEPASGTGLGDALLATDPSSQTVAAIPIRHSDTVYGLVAVHSTTPFSTDEVSALSDLASLFGYATSAVEARKLLMSDCAVELDLSVADPTDPLIDIVDRLDCRLTVEGLVPSTDSVTLCYARLYGVTHASAEAVLDEAVSESRVVGRYDDGVTYELHLDGPSIVRTMTSTGGVVQDLSVERGVADLTIEVAPDADVRAVVEALEGALDGVSLRAQRQITRSAISRSTFRTSLAEDLTDQQRAALEAAYAANYFEWPRGTTAEELAASLDIASPTLHQHLRAAKRKLLEAYFDEAGGLPSSD